MTYIFLICLISTNLSALTDLNRKDKEYCFKTVYKTLDAVKRSVARGAEYRYIFYGLTGFPYDSDYEACLKENHKSRKLVTKVNDTTYIFDTFLVCQKKDVSVQAPLFECSSDRPIISNSSAEHIFFALESLYTTQENVRIGTDS